MRLETGWKKITKGPEECHLKCHHECRNVETKSDQQNTMVTTRQKNGRQPVNIQTKSDENVTRIVEGEVGLTEAGNRAEVEASVVGEALAFNMAATRIANRRPSRMV